MNEYLRKEVGDRRTGANITGISVNLENMSNLTNDFTNAFNQIEQFARQSDELAIRNEKTKLMLDIEQRKVNFRQTYLDDPSTYASDEKFQEVGRLYKQEMVDAQKAVLSNKYISHEEKMILNKEIKLDFSKSWLDPAKKRNMVVSQDRINDVVMINDTLVNIASTQDFNRTDVLPNYVKQATKTFNPLITMGILTEGDVNKSLVKGMSQIEGARLKQMTLDKIINNPSYSDSEKEQMLKEAMESLSNDSRIKELASALTSEYGFDDQEKAYLESSLKKQYMDAKANLEGTLGRMTSKKKEVIKEKNIQYLKAYNEGNFYDYIKATGYKITGKQLLENEQASIQSSTRENSLVYQVTGKTITEINQEGLYVKNLLPKETISNMNTQISKLQSDGMGLYNATFEVLSPMLENVDDDIAVAIINSLSAENPQYSNAEYKYMLKGIRSGGTDADFKTCVKVNDLMELGGTPSSRDVALLSQLPEIGKIANKIINASGGKIGMQNAVSTIVSLAMGINARDGVVPLDKAPENVSQQGQFMMHVLTDKGNKVLKTLERELDNNTIGVIAKTKSRKHIMTQVEFK